MPGNKNIPRHLGLILDGNRRWARSQGIKQLEGHRKGYENLKDVGLAALEAGVEYVSAYVFSTENWNRSETEVNYLMKLLSWVATEEIDKLHKQNIRVRMAGSRNRLSKRIIQEIKDAERKTKGNTGGQLILCLNYGGHQEIIDAVKAIINEGMRTSDISKEAIESNLYLPDVPPVDLIVRTSGEQRLSNFMLWRAAYSELIFVDKHWPEFNKQDLSDCLEEYSRRQRRFGQ